MCGNNGNRRDLLPWADERTVTGYKKKRADCKIGSFNFSMVLVIEFLAVRVNLSKECAGDFFSIQTKIDEHFLEELFVFPPNLIVKNIL